MTIRTGLAALAAAICMSLVGPAWSAGDCGDPPGDHPRIPDGKRAAREDMLAAVEAVKDFSQKVDAFLACKDERAAVVFRWLNEDQRARWDEDLDAVHQDRIELQRQMNEAIRTFNEAQAAADAEG